MILFFVWSPGLFKGDAAVPKRSYALLIVTTLLSAIWFLIGWRDGLAIQGERYNYFVCAVNVVWVGSLWLLSMINRKAEPTFKRNLLFHWIFFLWLAWYAFPFFGEMT